MMIRWSTDAYRRDPSIVSSNLTNPTSFVDLLIEQKLSLCPGQDTVWFSSGVGTYTGIVGKC